MKLKLCKNKIKPHLFGLIEVSTFCIWFVFLFCWIECNRNAIWPVLHLLCKAITPGLYLCAWARSQKSFCQGNMVEWKTNVLSECFDFNSLSHTTPWSECTPRIYTLSKTGIDHNIPFLCSKVLLNSNQSHASILSQLNATKDQRRKIACWLDQNLSIKWICRMWRCNF